LQSGWTDLELDHDQRTKRELAGTGAAPTSGSGVIRLQNRGAVATVWKGEWASYAATQSQNRER